jgi:hypothetical protein
MSTEVEMRSSKNNFNIKSNSKESELLNQLERNLGTDWNVSNILTLVEWLNIASLYILLLDKQISYYRKILNKITIYGLIVSTITSTVSLSQLSMSEREYPNLSMALKVAFSVTSIFTTITTGALKIMKIQENLEIALEYYKKWNNFAAEISGQLQIPIEIRKNALSIIIRLKSNFKELFTTRLPLTESVVSDASKLMNKKNIIEKTFKKGLTIYDIENDSNNCDCLKSWFCFCCYGKKKYKQKMIKHYFSNRITVYHMYQDIIQSELDDLVKKLNKTHKHHSLYKYRIEATKIVIENDSDNDSDSNMISNLNEKSKKKNKHNKKKVTFCVPCNIDLKMDMNMSHSSDENIKKDMKINQDIRFTNLYKNQTDGDNGCFYLNYLIDLNISDIHTIKNYNHIIRNCNFNSLHTHIINRKFDFNTLVKLREIINCVNNKINKDLHFFNNNKLFYHTEHENIKKIHNILININDTLEKKSAQSITEDTKNLVHNTNKIINEEKNSDDEDEQNKIINQIKNVTESDNNNEEKVVNDTKVTIIDDDIKKI